MEFFKDRNKWSFLLAGLFVLVVFVTAFYVFTISKTGIAQEGSSRIFDTIYSGLTMIFLSGGLAILFAFRARKEVMIYREKERDNFSLSGQVLTVSQNVAPEGLLHPQHQTPSNGKPSEVITVYAEDKSIRYISPAVERILGYKQIEMIGENDLDNVHPDHRASFSHIFSRLRENPHEKIKIQYAYKTKEGNYIWLESTGSNGMSDPAVSGYMLRSNDITARRLEEQAQRMRSKIQALSENSPDLIIRLEEDTITYINPVIE